MGDAQRNIFAIKSPLSDVVRKKVEELVVELEETRYEHVEIEDGMNIMPDTTEELISDVVLMPLPEEIETCENTPVEKSKVVEEVVNEVVNEEVAKKLVKKSSPKPKGRPKKKYTTKSSIEPSAKKNSGL